MVNRICPLCSDANGQERVCDNSTGTLSSAGSYYLEDHVFVNKVNHWPNQYTIYTFSNKCIQMGQHSSIIKLSIKDSHVYKGEDVEDIKKKIKESLRKDNKKHDYMGKTDQKKE